MKYPRNIILFLILLYPCCRISAQEQLFQSYNNIGARAAGLGQAYTALVDDPTAIYWNPAAMSEMKRGFTGFMLRHGVQNFADASGYPDGVRSWQITSDPVSDLGFLGLVFPFHGGIANSTLGVGVRRLVPFPQRQWENVEMSGNGRYLWEYHHSGAVNVFTVAIALQISQALSLGSAFNFYTGEEEQNLHAVNTQTGENSIYDITQKYSRTSFHLGIRYQLDADWIFGFNLNLPHTLDMKQTVGLEEPVITTRQLSLPLYFNLAGAWKPDQRISVTADFYYRPWQLIKISSAATSYHLTNFSAHALHLGAEYSTNLWTIPADFRLGYYSDPTMYFAVDKKQIVNHTITAGIGYPGEWIEINLGIEWIPNLKETRRIVTILPGFPSDAADVFIKSQIIRISFDLFVRIT